MKDLSSMLSWEHGLNAGESMAGGNTTCVDESNYALKAPGSESVYPRPETTDAPNLEIPGPPTPVTTVTGVGHKPGGGPWTSFGIATSFKDR